MHSVAKDMLEALLVLEGARRLWDVALASEDRSCVRCLIVARLMLE